MNSLGTLALKNIEGGLVTDVVSQHPVGLIQTMVDAHDLELDNLSWSSDRDLCKEIPSRTDCGISVIGLEPGSSESESQFNSGIRFKNIDLENPNRSVSFKVSEESGRAPLSRDITVDGLTIISNPVSPLDRGSPPGTITLRSAATHMTHVRYVPVMPRNAEQDPVRSAVFIQSRSTDTGVEMTIESRGTAGDASACRCVIEGQPRQTSRHDIECRVVKCFAN